MPPNGRSLDELLADLLLADPADRIDYREPILAFGPDAIQPLKRLVIAHPALEGSVSSWLGHLARTRPETATDVRAALRVIAKDPTATMAPQVLASFGGTRRSTATSTRSSGAHRGKSAACEVVHARLIESARAGRTVYYSDLETSRGHIGTYLHTISLEEADLGRPPLTSIVVSKTTKRPGDGYILAMVEVGFATEHEHVEDVWQRATAAVFDYWREHP